MPIIGTLPTQLLNGTVADAPSVMTDFNYIVQQVNANAAASGANNDITSLLALTTPLTPAQGGSGSYTTTTPSAGTSTYSITALSPLGFTYAAGRRVIFLIGSTNTSVTNTLDANGTGAKPWLKRSPSGNVPLAIGDLVAGEIADCIADGTNWILTENISQGWGPLGTVASAATTPIGTINSRNVSVTGVVTITSFGNSTANVSSPIYRVIFAGALILTHVPGTLNLPNGVNITTVAGDVLFANYDGSGQWTVFAYFRATGRALTATDPFPTQTSNALRTLSTDGTNPNWSIAAITAYATISAAGAVSGAFNIASAAVVGTGVYDITLTTPRPSTNYQIFAFLSDGTFVGVIKEVPASKTTSVFRIVTTLTNGVAQAFAFYVLVVGGF